MRPLNVFLNGRPVGVLRRETSGAIELPVRARLAGLAQCLFRCPLSLPLREGPLCRCPGHQRVRQPAAGQRSDPKAYRGAGRRGWNRCLQPAECARPRLRRCPPVPARRRRSRPRGWRRGQAGDRRGDRRHRQEPRDGPAGHGRGRGLPHLDRRGAGKDSPAAQGRPVVQAPGDQCHHPHPQAADRPAPQRRRPLRQRRERVPVPEAARRVRRADGPGGDRGIRRAPHAAGRALRPPVDPGRAPAAAAAGGYVPGPVGPADAEIPGRRWPRHARDRRSLEGQRHARCRHHDVHARQRHLLAARRDGRPRQELQRLPGCRRALSA